MCKHSKQTIFVVLVAGSVRGNLAFLPNISLSVLKEFLLRDSRVS